MKTLKTLEPLTRRLLEIQRVNSAASVLSWDQETYMPAGGGAARAEQIATLQGIAHQKLVSLETERLLGGIISGELDVDKMDYLLRDSLYCGVRYGSYDLERLLDTLSFEAPDKDGTSVTIDRAYVDQHLGELVQDPDLSRYIL